MIRDILVWGQLSQGRLGVCTDVPVLQVYYHRGLFHYRLLLVVGDKSGGPRLLPSRRCKLHH